MAAHRLISEVVAERPGPVTRFAQTGSVACPRQLDAARSTSEVGRYLPVNIFDSGRSGRRVRVCAEFQSIGLANRFEPVYLDKPGVAIYGWGASLVRMPAHGPFPGLDAVS